MPELRLPEVRLPELALPEMSRDDIVRVIGDVRRDIDLPEVDLPRIDRSSIDLARVDLSKAIAAAAQAAGLVRRPTSRLPIVLAGAITVAAIGFALVMSPAVRPRLTEAARRWREQLDARRGAKADAGQSSDAVAIPVEPAAFSDIAPTPAPTSAMPTAELTPADEVASV